MIETDDSKSMMILAEALQIKPVYIAAIIAGVTLVILALAVIIFRKKPHETDPEKLSEKLLAAYETETKTHSDRSNIPTSQPQSGKEEPPNE